MKHTISLILSILLLLTLFSGCKTAEKANTPAAPVETEPARTFEGCTKAASAALTLADGTCSAVVLNTADGMIGLLIYRGTELEVPSEDGSSAVKIKADGYADSAWYNGDTELRAEGCVKAEKPADLNLDYSADAWYKPEKLTVLTPGKIPETTAKPVIYLYPETETTVSVRLDFAGELTCTYPAYKDGWTVTAAPDGTLTDADGKTYSYLFWEGESGWTPDFSEGFCVPGKDTASFLEQALADLGLTLREANEFIVYWLPQMQNNPWNLISFQQETYTDAAKLAIDPNPDTLIRVFMAWKPLDAPEQLEPQTLNAPARTGFTVVEWGGRQCN